MSHELHIWVPSRLKCHPKLLLVPVDVRSNDLVLLHTHKSKVIYRTLQCQTMLQLELC